MQSLIAVIFKEDMDRAEAYRVELRGREELAGLVDCSKMVAAVCDKEGKVHLQYTHALAKDGCADRRRVGRADRIPVPQPAARHCRGGRARRGDRRGGRFRHQPPLYERTGDAPETRQLGAVHPSEEGSRRRNVACARQFRRRGPEYRPQAGGRVPDGKAL